VGRENLNTNRIEDPDGVEGPISASDVSRAEVRELLDALHIEVRQAHKGCAPRVWLSVTCYVESALGVSTAAQANDWLKRRRIPPSKTKDKDFRSAMRDMSTTIKSSLVWVIASVRAENIPAAISHRTDRTTRNARPARAAADRFAFRRAGAMRTA
jgi:hypothetical protein